MDRTTDKNVAKRVARALGARRSAKESIPLEVTEAVKLATEKQSKEIAELRAHVDLLTQSNSVAVHSLSFLYAALQEVSLIVGSRAMTATEGLTIIGESLSEAAQFVEASEYYNREAAKNTIKKEDDPDAENSKELEAASRRLTETFRQFATRDKNLIELKVGIANRVSTTGQRYLDDEIMGDLLSQCEEDGN